MFRAAVSSLRVIPRSTQSSRWERIQGSHRRTTAIAVLINFSVFKSSAASYLRLALPIRAKPSITSGLADAKSSNLSFQSPSLSAACLMINLLNNDSNDSLNEYWCGTYRFRPTLLGCASSPTKSVPSRQFFLDNFFSICGHTPLRHATDELLNARVTAVEYLLRASLLQDIALVHKQDAVGDLPGEAHLVGYDEQGRRMLDGQ